MKTTKPTRRKPKKDQPLWVVKFNSGKGGMWADIDFVHPYPEVPGKIPVHYRARTCYFLPLHWIEELVKEIKAKAT